MHGKLSVKRTLNKKYTQKSYCSFSYSVALTNVKTVITKIVPIETTYVNFAIGIVIEDVCSSFNI